MVVSQRRLLSTCAYRIFDLEKGTRVSTIEVKKLYKKLAIKHHPDTGGNAKLMQGLNEAYKVLLSEAEVNGRRIRPTGNRTPGEQTSNDEEIGEEFYSYSAAADSEILGWLREEQIRQREEKLRREREQEQSRALESVLEVEYKHLLESWNRKRLLMDAAEATLLEQYKSHSDPRSLTLWSEAYDRWIDCWTTFNKTVAVWGKWKGDPYEQVGMWVEADKYKKGLWDSDSRQWRGHAWSARAKWDKRNKTNKLHPT